MECEVVGSNPPDPNPNVNPAGARKMYYVLSLVWPLELITLPHLNPNPKPNPNPNPNPNFNPNQKNVLTLSVSQILSPAGTSTRTLTLILA